MLENRVVIACAGSGKTYALIMRLLALLENGVPPGEIVTITFTKKAAAEIRVRLLAALEEKATDDVSWAQQALRRIVLAQTPEDRLNVHTFHGWFSLLLAGKSWHPGWFGPAQLLESDASLRELAWRRWVKKSHPQLPTVFRHTTPTNLKKKILLDKFAGKLNVWRLYNAAPLIKPETDTAWQAVMVALGDFSQIENHRQNKTLAAAKTAAEKALSDGEQAAAELASAFFTKEGKVKSYLTKDAEKNDYELLLSDVVEAYQHWQAVFEQAETVEFSNAIMALGRSFLQEYEAIKQEKNAMTFDDLEYNAGLAVREQGGIQPLLYRLQCRFKHVLIDEFQDSSPLQWQIIRCWLNATHGSDEAPSVFIVGDKKQAIYRFRYGDARLLSVAADFLCDYYQAERLDNNLCRRCAPPVLQLVNELFNGYMDDYLLHDSVEGVNDTLAGRVEWYPSLPKPDKPELRRNPRNALKEPLPSNTRQDAWATAIVRRLKDIIGQVEILDNNGGRRLCRQEDILVLLPKSTHAKKLATVFALHGMSCSLQGGGANFLQSFACQDIIALAKVLLSTTNSLSLAQVLRSPLFSFTDELLADVAATLPAEGRLWERLMNNAQSDTARAREYLPRWRSWAAAGRLPAHDLLSRIFTDGDVMARYCSAVMPPGRRQVMTDLAALLDFSLAGDGGRQPLLQAFVAAAQSDAAVGGGGDAGVRLMTVHKAKGLEAPIVVVADTAFGKEYAGDKADNVDLLIDWQPEDEAPALCVFKPRAFRHGFAELVEEEEQLSKQEYDNLLYVALTRARQILLIFSPPSDRGQSAQEAALFDAIQRIGIDEGERWVIGDMLPTGNAGAEGEVAPAPLLEQKPIGAHLPAAVRSGDALHQVMALLLSGVSEADTSRVLALADETVLTTAKRLLALSSLRELLDNCADFYTETEVISAAGALYRLDLLVVGRTAEVWIVDYKSGDDVSRYYPKMREYREAVAKLYPHCRIETAFLTAAGVFHRME